MWTAYKQDFNVKRPRGRPPKRWADHIRTDTGIVKIERHGEKISWGMWQGSLEYADKSSSFS